MAIGARAGAEARAEAKATGASNSFEAMEQPLQQQQQQLQQEQGQEQEQTLGGDFDLLGLHEEASGTGHNQRQDAYCPRVDPWTEEQQQQIQQQLWTGASLLEGPAEHPTYQAEAFLVRVDVNS